MLRSESKCEVNSPRYFYSNMTSAMYKCLSSGKCHTCTVNSIQKRKQQISIINKIKVSVMHS